MPEIRPFRAWTYSPPLRSRVGRLVSPPYDVISPSGRAELLAQDSLNSVQLCLADSHLGENRYAQMKATFDLWKREKTLVRQEHPAFYLVEDRWKSSGRDFRRLGFVGLLRLSPFSEKKVLPHEFTLSGPKVDRLELLRTMGAELSQIFFCYNDPSLVLEKIAAAESSRSPDFDLHDTTGVHRRLWICSHPEACAQIQSFMSTQTVLIADGHHRYETALAASQEDSGDKFSYVMGYFTNRASPGFSIEPIHRLFILPEGETVEGLATKLGARFEVKPFKAGWNLEALVAERDRLKAPAFLFGASDRAPLLLVEKSDYRTEAEVISLQRNIWESLLGWNTATLSKGQVFYEHTTEDFVSTLGARPRTAGFFLPPTDLDCVMRLAERGERMPQKSTFFFPKLASGLVIYELEKHLP